MWSNLNTLVLCTDGLFSCSSPSLHAPPGPRLAVDIAGAQITPGTLSPTPFKISGERWKHVCPLSERGSAASQNIVSADLVGVIRLSGVRVFTCISIKAGRRSNASDHSVVIKEGKRNLPAAYLSQEAKRWAPAAQRSRYARWGCATLNTFREKAEKYILNVKQIMAGLKNKMAD